MAAPAVSLSSVAVVMLAGTELLFCTTVPTLVRSRRRASWSRSPRRCRRPRRSTASLPDAIALVKLVVPRRSVATARRSSPRRSTCGIADGGLQRLVGDRLASTSLRARRCCGVAAAGEPASPLPIPSKRLLINAGAAVERGRGEEVRRAVEGRIDLLARERLWVVASRSAVDWSDSKFWRTDERERYGYKCHLLV